MPFIAPRKDDSSILSSDRGFTPSYESGAIAGLLALTNSNDIIQLYRSEIKSLLICNGGHNSPYTTFKNSDSNAIVNHTR